MTIGVARSNAQGIVGKAIAEKAAGPRSSKQPVDTRALLRIAEGHVKEGDHATACVAYQRVGEELLAQGFVRRAISAYAQALECAKAQVATHDKVAGLARALGSLYAREKLVREAIGALDAAAKFLVERGADASALSVIRDRLEIEDTEIARVRLGEALLRLGDVDDAVDQLQGVFERLTAAGSRDDAIEIGERLLHHRRDAFVARTCAELYLARGRAGDPFHALAKLRICCERDATDVPTLELLARAFDLARHPDKAARVRQEIVAIALARAPKRKEDSMASTARKVEEAWDELIVEADKRIDVARPSFWAVNDAAAGANDESVSEVSLAEMEVLDPPKSGERRAMLETTLESIDALVAQGRLVEADLAVERALALRPGNPLLVERKSEIEEMLDAPYLAPPRESERSVATVTRSA